MENRIMVVCPENQGFAQYMLQKMQELADQPKGLSENNEKILRKAHTSVCNSKTPITSVRDFSEVKGVGKWILRLMKGFFKDEVNTSEPENFNTKGNNGKRAKRYVPQKNSVAYALLIALYRGTSNGNEFMRKQELMDAAEASGLSRAPIAPEKGKGKPSQFGSSPREWYSGWSCMKTLITKGLVVKSSCPAKYMLSQEGKEASHECLIRSGLTVDSSQGGLSNVPHCQFDSLKSNERVLHGPAEVLETSQSKDISTFRPTNFYCSQNDQVSDMHLDDHSLRGDYHTAASRATTRSLNDGIGALGKPVEFPRTVKHKFSSDHPSETSFSMRPCSSSVNRPNESSSCFLDPNRVLIKPPLSFGERFGDAYEVILILDDREHFATRGSRPRKIIDNVCEQSKIKIEVRRLPVGDAIWIARHKYLESEYVLDFVVERKKVDDLRSSIRDNRYKDQKVKLLRCGLKKLIYVVEGDPNFSEAAESIKTACFTTEILEGFDVQRTSGLGDTLRKYGYLTKEIAHYYRSEALEEGSQRGVCPRYDDFIKRCQDLEKMTVSDVFAVQLMQVPQVTEEVALAVLDMYPTLISLAHAYSLLDGDTCAQEEMLKKQSNNFINAGASRNIFRLVWGD